MDMRHEPLIKLKLPFGHVAVHKLSLRDPPHLRYFSAIFGGGACPSINSKFSSKHAHAGALFVQMFMVGEIDEGSSKVPIRTPVYCGLADEVANKCEPQVGQKRRRTWLPLAATLVNSLSSP
jgi:hypothetical protein